MCFPINYPRKETMSNEQKDPDESEKNAANRTGAWLAIGVGLGVALGAAFDNIGMGIAIGVAIGVAMGMAQSRKNS